MNRLRRDAWAAAAVGLGVRLAIVQWAHTRFPPAGDGRFYDAFAHRLAAGLGYTWLWPDGAVTFAAHYPVGYPALLAAAYALLGGSRAVAMTLNAVLGAASAYAIHRLVAEEGGGRLRPACAAWTVALHPALVPYTAALMTEGITASLLIVGAAASARARTGPPRWFFLVLAGVVMGAATLVRPQSLLLAPLFGAPAVPFSARASGWARDARDAFVRASLVTAVTFACVAPWTARNCVRMHRCALVSVNGGWNLLIGATTETGGWQPISVPAACATVWDEAAKDVCFEGAASAAIVQAPGAWLSRVPSKLAMTFDYFGAAPWYLNASNPEAFNARAKVALGATETVVSRLLLLGALVACGRRDGAWRAARKGVAFLGSVAALTLHAWLGYLAIPLCVLMQGWRSLRSSPLILPSTAAVIAATVLLHAVFFGAGRYGLVVAPFVAGLAFVGPSALSSSRASSADRPPV